MTMPFYRGSYASPWTALSQGLSGIGQILARRQMDEDRIAQAQAAQRAAALSQPGAMTYDEAVYRAAQAQEEGRLTGVEGASGAAAFENMDIMGRGDMNVAPRFAAPPEQQIAIPGTEKSVSYQPATPTVTPSGIVQTDVGPEQQINDLLFREQVRQALTPDPGFETPEKYSPDWFKFREEELDMETAAAIAKAAGLEGLGEDEPYTVRQFSSPTQALNQLETSGTWEKEPNLEGGWQYRTPWGTISQEEAWDYVTRLTEPGVPGEMATPHHRGADPQNYMIGVPEGTSDLPIAPALEVTPGGGPRAVPDTTAPLPSVPGGLPAPSPSMKPDSGSMPTPLQPEIRNELGSAITQFERPEVAEINAARMGREPSPVEAAEAVAQQAREVADGVVLNSQQIDDLVMKLPLEPGWQALGDDRDKQRNFLLLKLNIASVDAIMKRLGL